MMRKYIIEGRYFLVLVIIKLITIAAGAVVNVNGKIAIPDSMEL